MSVVSALTKLHCQVEEAVWEVCKDWKGQQKPLHGPSILGRDVVAMAVFGLFAMLGLKPA